MNLSIPDTRTPEEKERMDRIDEQMAEQWLAEAEKLRQEDGDD